MQIRSRLPQGFLKVLSCSLLILSLCSFYGCGATLDPEKRKPLEILPIKFKLSPISEPILVRFEETLPGKPLPETVWDNVSGAFWDIKESNQIGFTQDYSKYAPAVMTGAVIGGSVGGTVVMLAAGPKLVDTRIVIPFGRIFSEVMESSLKSVFPNAAVCHDELCESSALKTSQPKYVLRIKVTTFQVWEEPLNHINLNAVISTRAFRPDQMDDPEFAFEAQKKLSHQSIGTVMTTSSGFIAEMNRISNDFAGSLCEEILEAVHKRL